MSSPSLLTTVEVAALLRIHPKQVYRLLKKGLPAKRVGSEWRFDAAEVHLWADGGKKRRHQQPSADREAAPFLAANGDVVIEILLERLNARVPAIGLVQSDSGTALKLLRSRAVLAAGCHGEDPPPRLEGDRLARIHLVRRKVGLAARPGKLVFSGKRLAGLRFACRPSTAGIMVHLRGPLATLARSSRAARHASHRDVACAVVRGDADLGLTTQAWAERTGLAFHEIAEEPYGLVVFASDLGNSALNVLCEVAQSSGLKDALSRIAGYDAAGAGDIRYDPERLNEAARSR